MHNLISYLFLHVFPIRACNRPRLDDRTLHNILRDQEGAFLAEVNKRFASIPEIDDDGVAMKGWYVEFLKHINQHEKETFRVDWVPQEQRIEWIAKLMEWEPQAGPFPLSEKQRSAIVNTYCRMLYIISSRK